MVLQFSTRSTTRLKIVEQIALEVAFALAHGNDTALQWPRERYNTGRVRSSQRRTLKITRP